MPAIPGQLDPITIRIHALPQPREVENGWKEFTVHTGHATVTVVVRPRIWNNFVESTGKFSQWSAIITGRMGELTDTGFMLEQPGIQVFAQPSQST